MGCFVDGELGEGLFLLKSDLNRARQIRRSIIVGLSALVSRQAIDFYVPI
jgi:hypothetical protein